MPDLPTRPPATPPTAEEVRRALAGVLDPELRASIVDLGMVKGVLIDPDGLVRVRVALTTAACPLRGQIATEVRSKVQGIPGVAAVEVEYGEMSQEERSALMQRARLEATRRAPETAIEPTTRVLAVASGKGGVGKSSVTANLAAALATAGKAVGVLDADIWGFSIPRMLGVAGRLGGTRSESGKAEILPHEVDLSPDESAAGDSPGARPGRLAVVSTGLLVEREDSALMWRGPVLAKALEQFLLDVRWGPLDYLLIDLPPGTGDIQMALARLLPQTEVVVVTTPARAAQQVAARVADMARRSYLKVLGVIENMSVFVAPDGSCHEIFGEGGGARLAEITGAPLLGRVPIEVEVSRGGDEGRPVVLSAPRSPAALELRRIADRIATELLPPIEMAGCTARLATLAALADAPPRVPPPA